MLTGKQLGACERRFVPGKFADRWMSQCGHKYTLPDGEKE
jgi:hypothetical protein